MVITDTNPNSDVQEREYLRLLGYPSDHDPGERARELIGWARDWYKKNGKPWVYARSAESIGVSDGKVEIEDERFSSMRLHHQLTHVETSEAIMAAVSAGRELEEHAGRLWEEGKPDEYFFLEVFGSAVVEHLIIMAGYRLCEWADRNGMAVLPHDSPGYPGWGISDQQRLLELLRRQNGTPGQLHALESGMLRPKKSLLAVFGVTHNVNRIRRLTSLIPCQSCSHQSCQYRRVPARQSLPRLEHTERLSNPMSIQTGRKSS